MYMYLCVYIYIYIYICIYIYIIYIYIYISLFRGPLVASLYSFSSLVWQNVCANKVNIHERSGATQCLWPMMARAALIEDRATASVGEKSEVPRAVTKYTQFAIQDSRLFGPNPKKVLAPPSNYLSK